MRDLVLNPLCFAPSRPGRLASGTVLRDHRNHDGPLPMAPPRGEPRAQKRPNPVAASEPPRQWVPRVYAIVGPDGAGKTTIARGIVHRLAQRGIKTRIVWMRSPRIVTLGVLGVLRMSRLAKTVRMGDH